MRPRHLLPDDDEVAGLLSLMLSTDARCAARTGLDGELTFQIDLRTADGPEAPSPGFVP